MTTTILGADYSIADKISRLEAEKIATKILSKTGFYAKQWDNFQARLENILFERIMMARIKKAFRFMDDEAAAYAYLDKMRKDFASGRKGNFNIMTASSEGSFMDGGVVDMEDVQEVGGHHYGEPKKPVLLYVMGGGFILPPSPKQIKMVNGLAKACGCTAVFGKHRLAPENPFPAACEDIADQYENLLNTMPTGRIIVGADTAGASILLGALQKLRERKINMPSGVLLFSPWCDLSLSGWSYVTRSTSSASPFRMESAAFCARLYLDTALATDPKASPIFADLDGFPRMCIHTSKHDMHFDDAVKLAENAHKASIYVKMNYWDTPRHHLERLNTKDAANSFDLAAGFVDECLAHYQAVV
ncbi:MAG: alpha/beta hydrolase fold domain-containing protein [Robiginitomaculum sp.]|nr:alpha/beta hydrolase fold domain-containing protein [Robiginitomaculum sp.]